MLIKFSHLKYIPFFWIVFDSGNRARDLLLLVRSQAEIYQCSLHENSQGARSHAILLYRFVGSLQQDVSALGHSMQLKIRSSFDGTKGKMVRIAEQKQRVPRVVLSDHTGGAAVVRSKPKKYLAG
jgi:hypothetical protein